MRALALTAAAVTLAACGHKKGPQPGDVDFWQVKSSAVDFAMCSDDMAFRSSITPVTFDANSYLIYRVEKDGKTATVLDCQTLDANTCTPSSTGITFQIAGTELFRTDTSKSMIGMTGCNLLDTTNWTLDDMDKTLSMEVDHVLSLVDDPMACDQVNTSYQQNSPNMTGLEGCLVKYSLSFVKN